MIPLPVTLATAAVCAIIFVGLSLRVVRGRLRHQIGLGDGGKPELLVRIRTHGNFAEYVPFALILMGLLELSGGNRTALMVIGASLVIARLCHAVGLPKTRGVSALRVAGTAGTFTILLVEAFWGLAMVV